MPAKRVTSRTTALLAAAALALTACSSSGGARDAADRPSGGAVAGTPRFEVAMITHASAGDTFFDILRKGADAAAAKDNIDYQYSNNDNAAQQATLIQNAVDAKVDAIAVSMPNASALTTALENAREAGIPVVGFNAGRAEWQDLGLLGYFGQDETVAGRAAAERLVAEGGKKVLCVIHTQGHVSLEERCRAVAEGAGPRATVETIYVNGVDAPSVQSTITAKLQQDKAIDRVITLGAPIALIAVQSIAEAGSSAKLATFDTNAQLVAAVQDGSVQWAVDQQPYLQGYEAIDSLWLYLTNGNTIGGGNATLTGPAFVDSTNIDTIATYAEAGTR